MSSETFSPTEVAEALRNAAGLITEAARQLHCSRPTVYAYIKKYPEVKAAKEDAEDSTLDLAESQLVSAIKEGHAWAICFYLKCKGKKRGYNEGIEVEPEESSYKLVFGTNGANGQH